MPHLLFENTRRHHPNHFTKGDKVMPYVQTTHSGKTKNIAGKKTENTVIRKYKRQGYKVTDTHKGYDFKATKRGSTKYIEVKSGDGRLTERQKAMKRRHGSNYIVEKKDTLLPSKYDKHKSKKRTNTSSRTKRKRKSRKSKARIW